MDAHCEPKAITDTMTVFGYPDTVIGENDWWSVLLRPKQVTAGALVLAAKSTAKSFGELGAAPCAALGPITHRIERMLEATVAFEKINYLMLMMNDPDVHFHVLPRYSGARTIGPLLIEDHGWPGPPDLNVGATPSAEVIADIVETMKTVFDEC